MKAFSETAVGRFLQQKAPKVIGLIGDVFPPAQIITNLFREQCPDADPAQLLELNRLLKEYEQVELRAYLADVADARKAAVQIQQAQSASFLARNIGYMIDIAIVISTVSLVLMLFFKSIPESNREIAYALLGVFITALNTVLAFHRGSSKGSSDKTEVLIKSFNKNG